MTIESPHSTYLIILAVWGIVFTVFVAGMIVGGCILSGETERPDDD